VPKSLRVFDKIVPVGTVKTVPGTEGPHLLVGEYNEEGKRNFKGRAD
jgi:hypothetical protein